MQFTSHPRTIDGVVERDFTLNDIVGILWTPSSASASSPAPLVLMGHPGDLDRMRPRLTGRAQRSAMDGFATATLELPGFGTRPPTAAAERARADLQRALRAGDRVSDDIIDRLVAPLVEAAVPEWQAAVDALLTLPEIAGPIGHSGGPTAIGIRLARVEPRIAAIGLFAGSFVPASTLDDARHVTIPVHMILQWDDSGNDRQMALDLFDAIGSTEKTLQANMGGHTGVPAHAGEDAARFFRRHLTRNL